MQETFRRFRGTRSGQAQGQLTYRNKARDKTSVNVLSQIDFFQPNEGFLKSMICCSPGLRAPPDGLVPLAGFARFKRAGDDHRESSGALKIRVTHAI